MADLAELRRSADRLAGLEDQADAEREIRNRLIREAMDAGHSYKAVAMAIGKSKSTVQSVITGD